VYGHGKEGELKPLAELSDEALARLAARSVRELPDAPPWLVESAISMWRAPTVAPSLGRRIAAVLGFDSWAAAPTLALRSATPGSRQWLFTAGERDIDLRVAPVEGSAGLYAVSGQLLGPGDDLVVSLVQGGAFRAVVTPDGFGEFHLGPLGAGRYTLTLQVAGDHIELPEIDVGGEAPP
jgi:hypothetical protein